jgi:protein TonB
MAFVNMNKPIYALKKDNYVSVSIDFIQSTPKKVKIVKELQENIPEVTEDIPKIEEKKIEIDDLFSGVWTKDIKKIQKKETLKSKRKLLDITKKIKTLKATNPSHLAKISDIMDSNLSKEFKKVSTGTEVDEYLGKINAIVYKYFYPPANSEGNSVKARIDLSAMGTLLDFTILSYSSNQYLNEECDKIKERLKSIVFPLNPNNKTSVTIVILTSKE